MTFVLMCPVTFTFTDTPRISTLVTQCLRRRCPAPPLGAGYTRTPQGWLETRSPSPASRSRDPRSLRAKLRGLYFQQALWVILSHFQD